MVIDILMKKTLNFQYIGLNLKNIIEASLKNSNVIFCVFKGRDFYANIDYQELRLLSSNEELYEYVDMKSIHEWVDGFKLDKVRKLFGLNKNISTIIAEKPSYDMDEILTFNKVDIAYGMDYVDLSLYLKLKQKGVTACIVKLPWMIKNIYGPFCKTVLTEQWLKNPLIYKMFEDDLKRITDLPMDEYIKRVLDRLSVRAQEKQLGKKESDRTVYLVGSCIVAGQSPAETSLAEKLILLFEKNNFSYNIIKINSRYFPNELLEYDICKNDIVIFLVAGGPLNYKDYDLTEVYEKYNGPKNICTDSTLHVSDSGCQLIADSIMKEIIIMHNNKIEDATIDNNIVHTAEKMQLQYQDEYEVKIYLKRTNIARNMRIGNNGAIVMNANPFTIGHRRLVEYASGKVERLFIFVVEEDRSFFTYEERLEMVLDGVKDINNVIVLGSGNFVISNLTFYDYFTKENDNDKIIDASQDIFIFARYIAPYFSIKKRFVGQEPTDKVTEQYNEQMKHILPNYGCELIEISRFMQDAKIISASVIREALHENHLEYVRSMLPVTSFQFIERNMEILQKRKVKRDVEKYRICMSDRLFAVHRFIDFISKKEKVIIYGIGKDAQIFLKLLKEEEKRKLVFVDKKAEKLNFLFERKEVFSPRELNKKLKKYDILILSSRYYKEIYSDCVNLGVDKKRIKYNSFDWYSLVI